MVISYAFIISIISQQISLSSLIRLKEKVGNVLAASSASNNLYIDAGAGESAAQRVQRLHRAVGIELGDVEHAVVPAQRLRALELAGRGMQVVGTATSESGAAAISDALAAFPGSRGVALDVNDAAGVDALIDAIVKQHGGLQVLVNNAGITRDTLAMRMKDEDWDAVLDTNLKGTFISVKACIPALKASGAGRIVVTSSITGPVTGYPGWTHYGASKAGQLGFLHTASIELAKTARSSGDSPARHASTSGVTGPMMIGPRGADSEPVIERT